MLPSGGIRLVTSGTLTSGEVFAHSQGFFPQVTPVDQAFMTAFAENAWSAFKTSFLTLTVAALFPTTVTWNKCRAYLIGAGGRTSLVGESTSASKAGTHSSSTLPNQCAVCLTLQTGVPGRAHRGRTYLPPPAVGIVAGGQLSLANATSIAQQYMAWLQAIADSATTPAVGSILSSSLSAVEQMGTVRCDTVIDTQRRRRDKSIAVGSFTSIPLVP